MSARDVESEVELRPQATDDPRIPAGQMYFKIGEAARIVGVAPHVLRYWETEFSWVRPEKTRSKQRRYRRRDLVALLAIKALRHDEQLTIAQTRQLLRSAKKGGRHERAQGALGAMLGGRESGASDGAADDERLRAALAALRTAVLELIETVEH